MQIVERKEVTHVTVDEVIIGRKCDICGKDIEKTNDERSYNYFVIHTWHSDWGYDSIDSHKYYDACCPECVMEFTKEYIEKSFAQRTNSREIEISHVRTLSDGAIE